MEYFEKQTLAQSQLKWLVFVAMIFPLITNVVLLSKGKMEFWPDFVMVSALLISTFVLMFFIRLKTQITNDGIFYRFQPFHRKDKFIAWNDIERAYIRKYDPLSEYGGWGLKGWKRSNRAVNISGDEGLQLVLKNGRKLLIGTHTASLLQQYLDQFAKSGIEALQKAEK
jgi:hypothetical protein